MIIVKLLITSRNNAPLVNYTEVDRVSYYHLLHFNYV